MLLTDLRYGLRMLARNPGFTAVAVLCLALGVAVNSTMFSLVDGYWMRPLPVGDPGGLVRLWMTSPRGPSRMSYSEYFEFRDHAAAFSDLMVAERRGPILSGDGPAESTLTNVVSDNYFTTLGVSAALGRVFTADVAGSDTEPVLVMSHNLWRRRYGGDPSIVGRTVRLSDRAITVIGVAPRGFRGTELWTDIDLWIPASSWEALSPGEWSQSAYTHLEAMGRLRPGVSIEQARTQVETVARRMEQAWPATNKGRGVTLLSESEYRSRAARYQPLILMSIVGAVLLIACANVANLLLARAEARRHEIALRLATGASRGRLVRQLLTESALIAALGAAVGLLLAAWLVALLPSIVLSPGSYDKYEFRLDHRVLGFTLALSMLTTLVFGLAPALHSSRTDLVSGLKGDGFTGLAGRRIRGRELLVAAQVALSLVMLTGAGLLIRTFAYAMQLDLGFEKKSVLVAEVYPPYGPTRTRAFFDQLIRRLQRLPAVRRACVTVRSPLVGHSDGISAEVVIPGYQPLPEESKLKIRYTAVGPDYFRVVGTRLLRGRDFGAHDHAESTPVVVINESMARGFWPNEDPIGKMIRIEGGPRAEHQIIGIVQDARISYILDERPEPYFFLPVAQSRLRATTLMVETAGDPLAITQQVRAEVAALDSQVPVTDITTLILLVRARLHPQQTAATIVSVLGLLGLFLAAVGLYGLMSYSVTLRTREIGIRMALGAQRRDAQRLVLRRGLLLAAIGAGVGLVGALAATRALSSLLHGVSPRDPIAFAAATVLVMAVALLAGYIPARRATRVDPVVALRYE